MRKLLLILLCLVPLRAFASSADSGICPWKLPFKIAISGSGVLWVTEYYRTTISGGGYIEKDSSYLTNSQSSILETIDTTGADQSLDSIRYSLKGGILQYSKLLFDSSGVGDTWWRITPSVKLVSLTIRFAPSADSIISLQISVNESAADTLGPNEITLEYGSRNLNFKASALTFNDTQIFTTDSSIEEHQISLTETDTANWNQESSPWFDVSKNFSATSATLSGIFRPTHYSAAERVPEPPRENASLKVYPLNNALHCSFAASVAPRRAKVYSVLGTRVASSQVPAGSTEATFPNLAPGFYLIRLGNEVAKAIIP